MWETLAWSVVALIVGFGLGVLFICMVDNSAGPLR